MRTWGHDELAADLAGHFRGMTDRMVWCDMQLGPSGSERPDVYTMKKSYSNPDPHAYEVKISMSDYRSDLTSGKWQKYYQEAKRVTFCVPQGLISKDDLPKGAGLMVRTENGWHTYKSPTSQPCQLSTSCLMKLLIDGLPRLNVKRDYSRHLSEGIINRRVAHKLGQDVADYLINKPRMEERLKSEQEKADKLRKSINELIEREKSIIESHRKNALTELDKDMEHIEHPLSKLRQAMGLKNDCSKYQLVNEITKLTSFISEDARISAARKALTDANYTINRTLKELGMVA